MTAGPVQSIAVVDFGGQYAHLIARRIRNLGLFSQIHQPESFVPDSPGLAGVVLSGGPHSVAGAKAVGLAFDPRLCPVPILGLCYGHQLLAARCGGHVRNDGRREYGLAEVACRNDSRLFAGMERAQDVWMSHGDHVETLPPDFRVSASTPTLPVAAFESLDGRLFGLQFHPEVTHTRNGMQILDNFLSVCTDNRDWQSDVQERLLVERVRREAGSKKLFLLISGGVDSLVTLALCIKAVGPDQVVSLHVDTGLMRKDESAQVLQHLVSLGFSNLHVEDAADLFIRRLAGTVEPEHKRHIIGALFVEVLNSRLADLVGEEDWMLVQGTIYPDTIESGGTDRSATIKTHHNRVPEIERLIEQGRVIEPLDQLYKDEVRVLGTSLGLPGHLVNRHPFPGPGLGIRILCSDDPEEVWAPGHDLALETICGPRGIKGAVLPVKSVGVQGDSRTYAHPAVLWTEQDVGPDWATLGECATLIANSHPDINRAVYSHRSLDGPRFVRRPVHMTRDRIRLLQEVDAVVRSTLDGLDEVWQCPVVSLPLFLPALGQVFAIRPVASRDAMTARFYEMDVALLETLCRRVEAVEGAGLLLYDVTSKPPATIEWE